MEQILIVKLSNIALQCNTFNKFKKEIPILNDNFSGKQLSEVSYYSLMTKIFEHKKEISQKFSFLKDEPKNMKREEVIPLEIFLYKKEFNTLHIDILLDQ